VPHERALTPDLRERFLREARAAATIHHPNVCPIYDVGTENGVPYLVMHFVGGGTLASFISARRVPFSGLQAAGIVRDIALGIAAAHSKGVLHRDLKPANVLCDESGRDMLVTDFGLARIGGALQISRTGDIFGTPAYMSPEQARARPEEIGTASDIYSLGVVLYRLLAGKLPFDGSVMEILGQSQFATPAPLSSYRSDLDPRLEEICLKALEKKPEDRFGSAKEFAAALTRLIRYTEGAVTIAYAGDGPPVPASSAPATPVSPSLKPASWASSIRPAAPAAPPPNPGETREIAIAPGVMMTFCWIPAGTAQLGSPKSERSAVLAFLKETKEPDWLREEAAEKRGKFTTPGFWMGKYPVKQEEWAAVMKKAYDEDGSVLTFPSYYRVGGGGESKLGPIRDTTRFPVENVSASYCEEFLNRATSLGDVSAVFGKSARFALPHEDEWEYACRGGLGNQPYYFGEALNGTQANCDGTIPFGTTAKGAYLRRPCPVEYDNQGSYSAHPWGLHHMHGNVYEWCSNSYELTDRRVLRGGSWSIFSVYCRAAYRFRFAPQSRNGTIGFRVIISGAG
jgi:formylglycine-generating enzyme required for sulfatase activity